MTPADATALLAVASAYDNRTVTETAGHAWAAALDPRITPADARGIVVEHYASSREWIMPADINTRGRALRRARLDAIGPYEVPAQLDGAPAITIAWEREYRRAIADGETPEYATRRACALVNIAPPEVVEGARELPPLDRVARRIPGADR